MNLENNKTEKKIFIYNTTGFISFNLSELKEINVLTNYIRFTINNVTYDLPKTNIFINSHKIEIDDDFLKNVYKILSKYE